MADIPKHLLERAAARRAALAGGEAPAPSAAPAEAESASVPAVPAASVPAAPASGGSGAGAPPAVPAASTPPPAPQAPRGLTFARIGSVFMLVAVPVWSFFMFNAFSESGASAQTPEGRGATLFAEKCSSCHGGNGAGSDAGLVGRPLYKGEVEKTFPNPLDQFAFVRHGSCDKGVSYGNPKREGGQHAAKGGMPNFAASAVSDDDLIAIIQYERQVLNDKKYPVNLLVKVGDDDKKAAEEVPAADLTKTLSEVKIASEDVCGK